MGNNPKDETKATEPQTLSRRRFGAGPGTDEKKASEAQRVSRQGSGTGAGAGEPNAPEPQKVSRRGFALGAGTGVAGLLVGGGVGYAVIPKPKKPTLVPAVWIGRDPAACSGCRLCQISCSQIKEQKVWPGVARIWVRQYYPGIEFPVACYQCGPDARCIEACPTSALSINEEKQLNTIAVNAEKCTRVSQNSDCTLCYDKCPGLAVTFHPKTRAPLICDLCDGDPACVKVCPDKTITLRGVKMAAVAPDQIAAAMADAYKLPPPPPKPSGTASLDVQDDDDSFLG